MSSCDLLEPVKMTWELTCAQTSQMYIMWTSYKTTTLLYWMCVVEWYITRLVIENGHVHDVCYDEIGLCAQTWDNIMHSMGKYNWESLCDLFEEKKNMHSTSCKSCITTPILKL